MGQGADADGGRPAQDVDQLHSLAVHLPWMAAIMASATLILAFGSVLRITVCASLLPRPSVTAAGAFGPRQAQAVDPGAEQGEQGEQDGESTDASGRCCRAVRTALQSLSMCPEHVVTSAAL